MDRPKHDFKRMLLRLPHSPNDYAAVSPIAELASLLGAELIGTYVDDGDLQNLLRLPDAREFRAGSWQSLSSNQLALDLASASREAQRLFMQSAGPHRRFLRGTRNANPAARQADNNDIIVVIEPKSPIERATRQFSELLDDVDRSTSSILWVPSETRRFDEAVVVVANRPDDPCISAAVRIAMSAKERLVFVPAASAPLENLAGAVDWARRVGVAATSADAVFHQDDLLLPAHVKAGLLVCGRERSIRRRSLLRVPLLLVSSDPTATDCDSQSNHFGKA
jgi:hypothetical protein